MGLKKLLYYALTWRVGLLLIAGMFSGYFALQNNFLGGGREMYATNPLLWSTANFDGEHYLAIAREGYKPLTYFFFPVYPVLIRTMAKLFGYSMIGYLYSGLFISHIALFAGLVGLVKLIRLDYSEKEAKWTVFLLFLFPTSFYFGSVYTESLFLALSVWSIYLFRKKSYWFSGLLGGIASATRIFGLALIPYYLVEVYLEYRKSKKMNWGAITTVLLTFLGLGLYMYYLYRATGDPLEFFNNISIFGQQRSSQLVLFPQVFYRYLFKVIPALNFQYFPVVFTTLLEISTAGLFLLLIGLMFWKRMWGYAFFSFAIFTLESFSGSFSSFPRYALNIFPVFIIGAIYFSKLNRIYRYLIVAIMIVCLSVALTLFSRGYWVS